LNKIEGRYKQKGFIKFIIYKTEDGMYKAHAASAEKSGFGTRVPI
jgi:hypothetical protein